MKSRSGQSVSHAATPIQAPRSARERLAGFLEAAAFALLLACVAARPFMAEMSFRSSAITASSMEASSGKEAASEPAVADTSELSRITFALGLLLAGAVWLAAGAVRGEIRIRHGWLVLAGLIFAALSFASAEFASNRRWALTAWFEQVAFIGAGLLALQLCRDRRRFVMVVVVLSAIAGTMAVKGLWEYFVEIPARVEDFQAHRAERLAQFGWPADSPQAKAFEHRLIDTAPIGFIALANPLASLLLVTAIAAAGLAVDKLRQAFAARKSGQRNWSSDIPMPVVAAILVSPLALTAMIVLLMTRSRGGIISFIVALVLGAAVFWRGEFFRRHWKKLLLSAAGLLIAAVAAVTVYGIGHDSLPTKTMTFRWMYWKGSVQIVKEHSLLGVGPANFSTAYLRHREARAEEAVKNPHNLPMHCLAEYGIPGTAAYLTIIGAFLVLLCRPARRPGEELPLAIAPADAAPLRVPASLWAGAAVTASVLVARAMFGGVSNDPDAIFCDAVVPAVVMLVMLAIAWWAARDLPGSPAGMRATRIALGVAAGAFVLHDMVNFALFMPAPAAAFWLAAGAAAAQADAPPSTRRLRVARITDIRGYRASIVAVVAFAFVAAAGWTLFVPVQGRTAQTQAMLDSLQARDATGMVQHARHGANADQLDGLSAADAAKALALACPPQGPQKLRCLQESYQWAQNAISRDAQNSSWHRLAGAAAARLALVQSAGAGSTNEMAAACLDAYATAVKLNPQDARQRVEYAQWLLKFARPRQALEQLHAAMQIDNSLFPDSGERFTHDEQQHVEESMKAAQKAIGASKQ